MRLWLLLPAILLLFAPASRAESVAELQILEAFFARDGMENRALALSGAALERYARRPTLGEALPAAAKTEFRLLEERDDAAIYEAVVSLEGRKESWSAFFVRGRLGAKLEAIKALNLPPYLAEVEYKRLAARKGRTAAEAARLHNLELLFMAAAELKDYFNANRATFEEIAALVEAGKADEAQAAARAAGLVGALAFGAVQSEGELALQAASAAAKGPAVAKRPASEIRIGGFLDGVVGLLHLPPGESPPPMAAHDYIAVEAVAEGWYLFRNLNAAPLADTSAET